MKACLLIGVEHVGISAVQEEYLDERLEAHDRGQVQRRLVGEPLGLKGLGRRQELGELGAGLVLSINLHCFIFIARQYCSAKIR